MGRREPTPALRIVTEENTRRRVVADGGRKIACPYCGSHHTERTAEFGPFHMTEQYHCRRCLSPFSYLRWEEGATGGDGSSNSGGVS